MGFFDTAIPTTPKANQRLPVDLLNRHGCKLCTLDRVKIDSPKMEADGAENPLVYCLGEAPGEDEDRRDRPFVGRSGRLLRSHIPRRYEGDVRFSNVIQCWPGKGNPDPTEVQIECCRPRVVEDIEKSKPKAILGFGNFALAWATGQARITQWRGRRLPVKVGQHCCWFYPIMHPSFILHKQDEDGWGSDEQVFGLDMARAFAEIERLPEPVVHSAADARRNLLTLRGDEPGALQQVEEFLRRASKASHAGVDYETYPKRPYAHDAKILSAGVSVGDTAMAFAFDHREAGWSAKERARLQEIWVDFLRSSVPKVSHFLGFELEWSGFFFGRDLIRASRWEDTASQAATLDERVGNHGEGPLSLGWLTHQHFGFNLKKLSNLDRKRMDLEPIDAILPYNAMDARYHDYLFVAQDKLLRQVPHRPERYELMLQRVPTVVLTQLKGIPVDPNETALLQDKYGSELYAVEKEISEMPEVEEFKKKTGEEFNPGSNPHVGKLIKDVLNIFNLKNADEEALKTVDHPFAPAIIKYRKFVKRKSTYVDAYTEKGYLWPDGKLHPNLNTLFAETGRSSADEPNVQNVEKHSEGKEVRKQIKARPGYVFVSVDQGQIQGRNIAMESRDPVYCKMLWEDYDVHTDWAERLSRRYPDVVGGKKNFTDTKIMKEFRQTTKNKWTFPLFFGASEKSVCGPLGIPLEYIQPEFKEFWRVFGGIREWQERKRKQHNDLGYVESLAGGRRHAPLSWNRIINSPIQDDEAAIVFDGMNRLSERNDDLLQPIMEIHDDLLFELPVDGLYDNVRLIVTDMLSCDFDWINVPLSVEVSIGADWYSMHEEAKFRSDKWLGFPVRAREYL